MRHNNKQRIYQYIRDYTAASKQDLVLGLGLSLPTVTKNINDLEEQGLIFAAERVRNTGGRDAVAYSPLDNARVAIGLDISKNHIHCVVVNLEGKVIYKSRIRVPFQRSQEYFKHLGDMVVQIVETQRLRQEDILGVGVGLPGLFSEDGEEMIFGEVIPVKGLTRKEITEFIPYDAKIFHDAFAAGYAEIWNTSNIPNAFYFSLCNSIGGSVLFDAKIYPGDNNKSGEVGHIKIVPNGLPCYCGQKGCLENYCNALALANHTNGNLDVFFERLDAGDEEMEKVWDNYLEHLAIAIDNVRTLLDCKVILGGYVGSHMEGRMEALYAKLRPRSAFSENPAEFLLPCKYKIEAIAAGAAIMFIEKYIMGL